MSTAKDWCTPPQIIHSVRNVFNGPVALDPCANEHSLVHADKEYHLPDHDGLVESWDSPTIYVNPPYGSDKARGTRIAHWFAKIAAAADDGSEVIALVPVATNTRHWKRYVYPVATAICFLDVPRLRFYINGVEDPKGAPMSCAVLYYGTNLTTFAEEFSLHGVVIPLKDTVLHRPGTPDLSGEPVAPHPRGCPRRKRLHRGLDQGSRSPS